jgi:hypothetical protein
MHAIRETARAQSEPHAKYTGSRRGRRSNASLCGCKGGGALGSYQAGATKRSKPTYAPIEQPVSIDSLDSAIIAGNAPGRASREGAYLLAGGCCELVFGWTARDRWSPK